MVPGSSWDSEKGFDLRPFDYSQKDRIIAEMQEKYREKLEKQYAKEEKIKASFKAFHRYFSDFLESTPVIARKMLLPKIQFHVTDPDGEHFWFVDAPNKKIEELKEKMGDAEITVSVPALVLNDCVRRKMFSVWSASKRLEVELEKDKLAKFHTLLSLLDFYENEGLPLRSNFSARNFPIWLSRWREAAEAARLVLVYKVLRRKLVISELYSGNSKSELTLSAKESG
jgi:hypothetical protein